LPLRVLFLNPRPYLPQLLGGVETTTFDLVEHLRPFGHPAAVMCQIRKYDRLWLRNRLYSRLTRRCFPVDLYRGTQVYRGYDPVRALPEVLADFRPDVLVIAGGSHSSFELAGECVRTGVPTAFYFHELIALREHPAYRVPEGARLLANSHYTARTVRDLLGREATVIPPLVDPAAYRTATTRQYVTMINPRASKGGQTAIDLARACPDIPFLLVEAWYPDNSVPQLRAAAAALPNVIWRRATLDMRGIYATTRILLVPSVREETWGRVVTEAQASGIPALARAMAALPESVGPAGVLVPADAPVQAWVQALRTLWDEPKAYETLVLRAFEFAARAEAQPTQRMAEFIAAIG
jgi:glycosyltransferase involved in cell wall biosynthesis